MNNVLIVDDKEENLYYLHALLSGSGYNVTQAHHGAEALVLARQSQPNLIISDLLMPVMDGYTLLYHWKSDARLRQIPFIVYTATYTEAEDERLALSLGADAFILKPTEPEDFLARMHEVQANAVNKVPTRPKYPHGEEAETLKLYSETLIRKLEEKSLQLEEANRQLQADIAVRNSIEAALRESEAEFRLLTETMPQIVWMARPDGWHYHVNQRWVDYTGLSFEEGLGENWIRPFHPDDHARAMQDWEQATRTGEAYEIEYQLRRADGVYRWMLSRALPLRDEKGVILKWFGTCTDIDDLKQAEESAHKSEIEQRNLAAQLEVERAQLITAQTVAKLGSWETDLETLSVTWSLETCRIFEFTPECFQLSHERFLEAVHPDDLAAVIEAFSQSLDHNARCEIEHRILTPDGRIKFVNERWQVTFDEQGKPCRAIGTCQDITERKYTEAQRDRFFTLSLDLLCIADMNGYYKRVNPSFSEILGYTSAELLNEPFINFVHPDDLAATMEVMTQLSQGNPVVSFENRYRTKDGEWCWLEWKSVAALDDGEVYAAARNITERKKSEVELRRVHDELESRVQRRTLELEQANKKLQVQITEKGEAEAETRIVARQQEAVAELGRRALTDIDIDTLLQGATALVEAALDVEISIILELTPDRENLRFRAGTGWKTESINYMIPGDTNSQAGYTLLADAPTIVTDLRTETRFIPSDLLLQWGVISGVTVIVGGYEGPFGTLGAYTYQQRDFTQDDVHFLQSMSNVLGAALERRRIETEIRQLNDQLKRANIQLKTENTERLIAMGALREIAQGLEQAKEEAEVARENAEVANLAKSEFLSRMSHELRTPLNAILGFGQILEMRNQNADAQQKENIQMIIQAGRHLLTLINEVLDVARIEAGHLSLSLEPVTVGPIVREVMDLVAPLAANRQITLRNEIKKEEKEQFVLADQQRIKQVLLNLLSNAVKYNTYGGEVFVTCQSLFGTPHKTQEAQVGSETGWLRVSVRDTGSGLTQDEIGRLFEPFERLSAGRSQIEGTGIGLSLCKRLVSAMSGRVGVESQIGVGSTFWIEIPIANEVAVASDTSEKNRGWTTPLPILDEQRTIVYIEDNLSNIRLIEHVLADQNRQIRLLPAMQGGIGLELATQHRPNLILLDIDLPDLRGDEVLKLLKANPLTKDIPVVILSADATRRQIENLLSAGASHYLTKPIDLKQFFSVLNETLNIVD